MQKYRRLKYACYTTNITMAIVGNMPPVLFLTFRTLYGISYSLLGLLILIGFVTQLIIDLIFSFFSHKFNIPLTVKLTPFVAAVGLLIYAAAPIFFPNSVYLGLVIGTFVFSFSSGLAEVLISPVIAAIPSKDPDREMSKLHSVYAWGVVPVIIISTLFILLCGSKNWQFIAVIFSSIPLLSCFLFFNAEIPQMETPEKTSSALGFLKNKTLLLCVLGIFFGGAAECTMAQWSSSYIEKALNIPKVWGDIFGVALFGVMLGLGRTLYAKKGKNITKVMIIGSIGAALCYGLVAITENAIIGLTACAFTGFCTAMLWPGSLVAASDRFPKGGVFVFALMAAGGDLGASVGPQLVGIITDAVIQNPTALRLAESLSLNPEQIGMKAGMLVGMLFPVMAIFVFTYLHRKKT